MIYIVVIIIIVSDNFTSGSRRLTAMSYDFWPTKKNGSSSFISGNSSESSSSNSSLSCNHLHKTHNCGNDWLNRYCYLCKAELCRQYIQPPPNKLASEAITPDQSMVKSSSSPFSSISSSSTSAYGEWWIEHADYPCTFWPSSTALISSNKCILLFYERAFILNTSIFPSTGLKSQTHLISVSISSIRPSLIGPSPRSSLLAIGCHPT